MKNQPVLQLPASTLERFLDAAAILFSFGALLLAVSLYPGLPDQIPIHFNGQGTADNFGPKNTLFILPGIAVAMALGLIALTRYPHQFNYLTKITPENAAFEYGKARLMLRVMNVLTSLLFLVITWELTTAASGTTSRLGWFFWVILAAVLVVPPVVFFTRKKPQ